jgi:NAD(P)-dependent dehydrogenase (short-subunit alcohol dehydrogenase family)
MDLLLKDRVAVVTGAGSGVGREITRVLCGEGASVAAVDIFEEKAGQTVEQVKGLPGKATAFKADVIDLQQFQEVADRIISGFGHIDILINNAGYGLYQNFEASTGKDWMIDININLIGVLNCTRAVINHMKGRRYGKVLNIVSDAGRVGEPYFTSYSAAKAGAIGFSKALAKEMGRNGINVNCIALGTTKTPLIEPFLTPEAEKKMLKRYPLGRLGLPADHAYLAAFLVSDRASWITGQCFPVNGGYSMF